MKRLPATSVEAAVEAFRTAAKGPPNVPSHLRLRPGDLAFWDAIIRVRPYESWKPFELPVAAQLARTLADIEREAALLDAEGPLISNHLGRSIRNPRGPIVHGLHKRQMAYFRALRLRSDLIGTG